MSERPDVYINAISTALPPHDFQAQFARLMPQFLSERDRALFSRLIERCQIGHRYSCLDLGGADFDFYGDGEAPFPTTGGRMLQYAKHALPLAIRAATPLLQDVPAREITHLVVGSCTGFYAPGLDCELMTALRLSPSVNRKLIGFMGCYAGLPVLQTARDIVAASPGSVVLTINLELCSLHLQKPRSLEEIISFAQFADGCAATVVSAQFKGLRIAAFGSRLEPQFASSITWTITDQGFHMYLDPQLPRILQAHVMPWLFDQTGRGAPDRLWAIHPGGRSILDVVQSGLHLSDEQMRHSRRVLAEAGNVSSATILFVLKSMLEASPRGHGIAIAFGPGLAIEQMAFEKV